MAEVFANNAASTLDGSVDASQTSITLTSGSSFPSTGNFRVKVDNEIMLCTARSGNVLTVERGVEGTAGATHADDAVVKHPLTAGGLTQFVSENGGGGGGTGPTLVVPASADFTLVHPAQLDYDDYSDKLDVRFLRHASDRKGEMFLQNRPGTNYTLEIGIRYNWLGQDNTGVLPLVFRNSTSGFYRCLFHGFDGNQFCWLYNFNGDDTFSGGNLVPDGFKLPFGVTQFFKVVSDGTYRWWYHSPDGVTYSPFHRESNTADVTEDQIGFGGYSTGMTIPAWAPDGRVHCTAEVFHFDLQ